MCSWYNFPPLFCKGAKNEPLRNVDSVESTEYSTCRNPRWQGHDSDRLPAGPLDNQSYVHARRSLNWQDTLEGRRRQPNLIAFRAIAFSCPRQQGMARWSSDSQTLRLPSERGRLPSLPRRRPRLHFELFQKLRHKLHHGRSTAGLHRASLTLLAAPASHMRAHASALRRGHPHMGASLLARTAGVLVRWSCAQHTAAAHTLHTQYFSRVARD